MRALLLLSVPLLLLGGCGRWMSYSPMRIQGSVRDPGVVYAGIVQRTQSMGYLIECQDPQRLLLCVRARLDQRRLNNGRANFLQLAVQRDGSVWVSVQGRRLRQGSVIHRKLCQELTAYLDSLVDVLDGRGPVIVPSVVAQRPQVAPHVDVDLAVDINVAVP